MRTYKGILYIQGISYIVMSTVKPRRRGRDPKKHLPSASDSEEELDLALQVQPQGTVTGTGKQTSLKLRLDLNLDVDIQIRARVHGDVTLSLEA
jgi:hypothetical protein